MSTLATDPLKVKESRTCFPSTSVEAGPFATKSKHIWETTTTTLFFIESDDIDFKFFDEYDRMVASDVLYKPVSMYLKIHLNNTHCHNFTNFCIGFRQFYSFAAYLVREEVTR